MRENFPPRQVKAHRLSGIIAAVTAVTVDFSATFLYNTLPFQKLFVSLHHPLYGKYLNRKYTIKLITKNVFIMRKLNLLFKSFLLLCALIAGSSAWAETKTITAAALTESVLTDSPFTLTFAKNNGSTEPTYNQNGGDLRLYAKGTVEVSSSGGKITQIVFNISVQGKKRLAPITASVGTISTQAKGDETVTWTGNAESVIFTVGDKANYGSDGDSKAGQLCFSSVDITYTASAVQKVSKPTISGNESFLTSTEVTISCGTEGATIQYSTNGGTSWTNYSAPFTLNETTTVKAKATKNGMTDSDEASKTFTKTIPITVAAALSAIDALADNGTIADQCVSGKVSQVDNFSNGSMIYWISDDGTTTSQLEIYYGKGLNGEDFKAKTDLNVGDEVTVFGTLQKYVKNETTTPEFTSGSKLLSYKATGTPTPSINASNVTIDSEATSGEITYTVENPTGASLTAVVKEGDWISNINVTASKVTFSVSQNTGEQRIGYITLSYTGAANKDVKVTQKATYGTATLPFVFDDGKAAIETTNGLTHNSLSSDYSSSPKLKFDGAGDYLILKINSAAQVLNFDIKGNGSSTEAWNGTFKVQTSADGVTYTDLKTYNNTVLTDMLRESLQLASSVRYIKWIYIEKTVGNVGVGRIGVNCEAISVSEKGYATFCTSNKIDFAGTEGVTAYIVSAIGQSSVSLKEITAAPENTPVVLKAAQGTYALNIAANAAAVTGNLLQVSDGNATSGDDYDV